MKKLTEKIRQAPVYRESDLVVRATIHDFDREAWDSMFESHAMSRSVYPMYFFASGWRELRLGLFREGTLIGGMLLALRSLPRLPLTLGRVFAVMIGPNHADMLRVLLNGYDALAAHLSIMETEVNARLPMIEGFERAEHTRQILDVFEGHGYSRLPRVDRSYWVKIDSTDDELLASFGSQPRNRIKKAQKMGAEAFSSADPALLDLFYESYVAMVDRKRVPRALGDRQIIDGMRPLLERGHAVIFGERFQGTVTNLAIVDTTGTPCMMLASRTKEHVAGEVQGWAQHVHYEAMRAMRDRGHRWYDFGGCEGKVPIESHPNFGVWRFKHAFNGTYVTFLPHLRKAHGSARALLSLVHRYRGDAVAA